MRLQGVRTANKNPDSCYVRLPQCLLGALISFLLMVNVLAAQETSPDTIEQSTDSLHERLTEREDESRLEEPYSIDLLGRPLYISGQFELSFDFLKHVSLVDDNNAAGRLLLEPELEAEMFYSFNDKISVFAQLRFATVENIKDNIDEKLSTRFVERGEMWVNVLDIVGSQFNFELGRLDFEDDRLWWWDTDLDAIRISHETEDFELSLALARELLPARSDHNYIEPEHDRVQRLLIEVTWDWANDHTLQAFGLLHRDRSRIDAIGQQVRSEREDESDARLFWLGLRATGAWKSDSRGLFGYWFDLATIRGDEWLIEYTSDPSDFSAVSEIDRQRVIGWAMDAGATWLLPLPLEPHITLGYARTSGDRDQGDQFDRSFRQTGLHGNEVGFGGVQRFGRYGRLLDPELSNMRIATAGLGISLLESSSLDLTFHQYKLVEPAEFLRDVRIDMELTGVDRDIGHAFDLVLALEEWQRFELELSASAFKPGRAIDTDKRNWTWGGFMAFRMAF